MVMILILLIALIFGGLTVILCFLKKNKGKTKYRYTMNVVFSAIAWTIFSISFVCAFYHTATALTIIEPPVGVSVDNYYLYFNNNEYEILRGEIEIDGNDNEIIVYYADNGVSYTELPENTIRITYKWTYYDLNIQEEAIAYQFYDTELGVIKYYSETGQIYDKLPEKITSEEPTSKLNSIVIITAGAGVALLLIWGTSKSQYTYEVEMQMKEEEKQKIIEKNT